MYILPLILLVVCPCTASFLDTWKATVQRPAVLAPTQHRWVYYSVNLASRSGGLADRTIGIMNALFFAMHSGRGFGIEWPELGQFLPPPPSGIRWDVAPPPRHSTDFLCQSDFVGCQRTYEDMLRSDEPVLRVSSNQNWVDGITAYPSFQRKYNVTQMKLAFVYGQIFRELFYRNMPEIQEPLACVQLRLGTGGGQTWEDSESFLKMKQIADVANHVKTHWPGWMLFITSDSFGAAQSLVALLGEVRLLRPLDPDSAVHIDRVSGSLGAVVDHFLTLKSCDAAIITERSGFGRCGLWLQGTPKKNSRFYVATKKFSIEAFCSVYECDTT